LNVCNRKALVVGLVITFGSLVYADDLTLLSPTAAGLQSLLSVCEEYGREYGMEYNSSKSHCVLFTRKKTSTPDLTLNGQKLRWEKQAKHLGNIIACDLSEKSDGRLKRSDLVGRVNVIVGSLHELSTDIILKMFASQCCHYYGTQTWQLSSSALRDFCTMWNRCVRRLLHLPNRTHCRFLPSLARMKSPMEQISGSFLRLYQHMITSNNDIVRFIAERGGLDAQSVIGGNLHYLSSVYEQPLTELMQVPRIKSVQCSLADQCKIQVICDILDNTLEHFTNNELYEVLTDICCN
jgi:hypothetical protein